MGLFQWLNKPLINPCFVIRESHLLHQVSLHGERNKLEQLELPEEIEWLAWHLCHRKFAVANKSSFNRLLFLLLMINVHTLFFSYIRIKTFFYPNRFKGDSHWRLEVWAFLHFVRQPTSDKYRESSNGGLRIPEGQCLNRLLQWPGGAIA